jgi:NADH/NAD ratio-sensing transcriptional regulator Rex
MYNGIYNKEQYAYVYDTLIKWLEIKIQGGGLGKKMLEKSIQKVALYGVNGLGKLFYQDIKDYGVEVTCFIDKNAERYEKNKDSLVVLNLNQLEQLEKDCYIIVTPEYYFQEIMLELLNRGISLERIISLSMVVSL